MEFINEHWVAIFSILLSALVTWLVAYLYWKRNWNIAQLALVYNPDIPLMHTLAGTIPELKFIYKEAEVSPNLCAIALSIVNIGKRDVKIEKNDAPLELNLPEGYKWESCEIFSQPDVEKISLEIKGDRALVFKWHLLKAGEAIGIFALVDSVESFEKKGKVKKGSISGQISSKIQLNHRLSDTVTRFEELNFNEMKKTKLQPLLWILSIPILLLIILTLGTFFEYRFNLEQSSKPIPVLKASDIDTTLMLDFEQFLQGLDTELIKPLSLGSTLVLERHNRNVAKRKRALEKTKKFELVMYLTALMTLIVAAFIAYQLREILYKRKLFNVIKANLE